MFVRTISFLFVINLLSFSTQGQTITLEDYQRAQSFLWNNVSNQQAFNLYFDGRFFTDSTGLWFKEYSPDKKEYFIVNFEDGQKRIAFDHDRLRDSLAQFFDDSLQSNRLPIGELEQANRDSLQFQAEGKKYVLRLSDYSLKVKAEQEDEKAAPTESKSPDGNWIAYIENYNLFIRSTKTDSIFQLSHNGIKNYEYASYVGWGDLIEGERGERQPRIYVNWSPDSKWIQTDLVDWRTARKMHLLDYSVDTLYRPRVLSYYRGSPGDTTMVHLTPKFYHVHSKKELPTNLERRTHINSQGFWWFEKSNQVLVVDSERGYKQYHYQLLDLDTGELRNLFSLSSDTRLHRGYGIRLFEQQNQFIYISEESGWRQIHSYNLTTEETKQLTSGGFVVHDISHTNIKDGVIFFTASGGQTSENPYHRSLYSINLDGTNQINLTPESGNHDIRISPCGQYFLDEWSTIEQPTQYGLKSVESGDLVADELMNATVDSLWLKGWGPAEPFTAIARDGETEIYGALWKPSNFSPNKKYPVIDNTYTGPHTNVFPRSFTRNFWEGHQDIVELGFIVVRIDGMGTYGRSKAFHDVSYKNMGQNLLDHVLAIQQLGKKYSWIDTTRVGIFGHSAGGYDAGHAVLAYPDFYKVAVASSADHDFRMEKAWWPEMYQGWPVDSTYHEVSNITMAPNLKGKLLITHGGLDENVNPSATFKLAEALIKANKEFDMLILPSQHHGYRGQYWEYFRKKRWNYFVEHLLGADPIWEIEEE